MSLSKNIRIKKFRIDWVLFIALVIGFLFCLYGITWSQGHPDDMAFRPLFLKGKLPLNPGWFHKPPFHTYFNYFLSTLPIDTLGKLFDISTNSLDYAKTVWSRILTSFLFLLSVVLVYRIIAKSLGLSSARIVSIIFATSAGFSAYSHFLTADIPVMFWMLLAFYFCFHILLRAKLSDYVLAGFFTGIATATKYNGLAIGIALAAAHFLFCLNTSHKTLNWKNLLLDKKIYIGLSMVFIGFVAGNPFCLLDFATFKNDFVYNYIVTPVYDGQTGNSYGSFFQHVLEVIGLPSLVFCLVALGYSFYILAKKGMRDIQSQTMLLSLSVLIIYYYKFGSFPRLETRFVLPLVPFFLIISALLWQKIKQHRLIFFLAAFIITTYNIACNFYVGKRFINDPRTEALEWVKKNIPENSPIESDLYTPTFLKFNGKTFNQITNPNVSGRDRLFASIFKNDTFILGSEADQKKKEGEVSWYSKENLLQRKPDFIAVNSLYYKRFTEPGIKQDLYPTMNHYFRDLLEENYQYRIVFDKESEFPPVWVYPKEIDFLHNRMTILARKDLQFSNH